MRTLWRSWETAIISMENKLNGYNVASNNGGNPLNLSVRISYKEYGDMRNIYARVSFDGKMNPGLCYQLPRFDDGLTATLSEISTRSMDETGEIHFVKEKMNYCEAFREKDNRSFVIRTQTDKDHFIEDMCDFEKKLRNLFPEKIRLYTDYTREFELERTYHIDERLQEADKQAEKFKERIDCIVWFLHDDIKYMDEKSLGNTIQMIINTLNDDSLKLTDEQREILFALLSYAEFMRNVIRAQQGLPPIYVGTELSNGIAVEMLTDAEIQSQIDTIHALLTNPNISKGEEAYLLELLAELEAEKGRRIARGEWGKTPVFTPGWEIDNGREIYPLPPIDLGDGGREIYPMPPKDLGKDIDIYPTPVEDKWMERYPANPPKDLDMGMETYPAPKQDDLGEFYPTPKRAFDVHKEFNSFDKEYNDYSKLTEKTPSLKDAVQEYDLDTLDDVLDKARKDTEAEKEKINSRYERAREELDTDYLREPDEELYSY